MLPRQSSSAAALLTSESSPTRRRPGRRPGERAGYTQPTLVADDAIAQMARASQPHGAGGLASSGFTSWSAAQRLAPQSLPPRVATRAID